jgi:methyl-accepting chemotaxis protein
MQSTSLLGGSLRNKLLLVLLLVTLIPLGILNYISYQGMKSQMVEDQGRRLSGYSRRIARTIDLSLNERIGDIAAWTTLETVKTALDIGGGQAGSDQLLNHFAESYGTFDLLMLIDRSGTCISSSLPAAIGL